jgi:hypothetical protein
VKGHTLETIKHSSSKNNISEERGSYPLQAISVDMKNGVYLCIRVLIKLWY